LGQHEVVAFLVLYRLDSFNLQSARTELSKGVLGGFAVCCITGQDYYCVVVLKELRDQLML